MCAPHRAVLRATFLHKADSEPFPGSTLGPLRDPKGTWGLGFRDPSEGLGFRVLGCWAPGLECSGVKDEETPIISGI